mgnify:FL=1
MLGSPDILPQISTASTTTAWFTSDQWRRKVEAVGAVRSGHKAHPENTYKKSLCKNIQKKIGTADRRTDRQIDGNGRPISLYFSGLERLRKCKSRESADFLIINQNRYFLTQIFHFKHVVLSFRL